jgi:hypothetical protein
MPHYVFNAIPTDESTELCTDLVHSCRNTTAMTILRNTFASGKGKAIVRSLGLGALRNLAATDHLYILMHGSGYGGTSNVGVRRGAVKQHERGRPKWVGGALKTYGVNELARALHKEGLPAAFVDVHLLTCGSGFAGDEETAPSLVGKVPAAAMAPLAKRLRDALVAQGHASVRVTGYKGDILTNIERNNWFSVEQDTIVPAAQAAVTF